MGTSLIVWNSLIGIIMASLAFGYWIGGVAADKKPSHELLMKIIASAAAVTALVAVAADPLLSALASGVRDI